MRSSRRLRVALGIALALLGVPASLQAQDPPDEPEPSISVPSLPATPRASGEMQAGDGAVACPPPAQTMGAPLAVPFSDIPFVPFMLGDFSGPLANPMTDLKISEGESPIPLDR